MMILQFLNTIFSPKSWAIVLCILFALPAFSQESEEFIHVYGTIKDYQTRRKLSGVQVSVKQDGKTFKSITTTANGKFEFFLPLDHVYNIEYGKSSYVSKNIEIDSRNVPKELRMGGFSMNTDVDIFESVQDVDFSFLENPIGKANWDNARGEISWNYDYIESVKNQIDRIMKEYEKAKKEDDKEEETANKEEEQRNIKFEKLMKDGAGALEAKKYDVAISKYQEALSLKKDNKTAQEKLSDAKQKKTEQEALAAANEKYNNLLDKADDALKAKNYDDAINFYKSALLIKENEKYPEDQIAQATLLKEEEEKAQAAEKEFNDLISQAETEVGKNEFDAAIANLEKALEIKPLDKSVKAKIQDAKKKKEDFLANQEKEEAYQAIISEADGLFQKEDYSAAIAKYKEAERLKSSEEYPGQKIKEAQAKIEEKANREKEAQELAKKEEQYSNFMAEGNRNLSDKKFLEAINNFKDALEVKQDDSEAQSKLKEAEAKKEEMQNLAEKEKEFDALVKKGEDLFEDRKYAESLKTFKEADALAGNELTSSKITEIEKLIEEEKAREQEELAQAEKEEKLAKELAEKEMEFEALVREADSSVNEEDYQQAIDKFTEALTLFPEDRKTQGKLESAQKKLEEANQALAEAEKNKREEEARLAEEEKLRKQAEEEKKKKEEEEALLAKQAKATEDSYDKAIAIADDLFLEKNYDLAIEEYEKAISILPDNDYPQQQIKRIQELRERNERERQEQERIAEERRKREEEQARQRELQKSEFSSDLEQEAEDYIAKLREERRKKKIEQSQTIKENWKTSQSAYQKTAGEIIDQNRELIAEEKDVANELNEDYQEIYASRVNSVSDFKAELVESNSEKSASQNDRIQRANENKSAYESYSRELLEKGNDLAEDNKTKVEEIRSLNNDLTDKGEEKRMATLKEARAKQKIYSRNGQRYYEEGNKKISESYFTIKESKEKYEAFHASLADENIESAKDAVNSIKSGHEKLLGLKGAEQNEKLKENKEKLNSLNQSAEPGPEDFQKNPLTDVYPQGITEEKEIENGKVTLIRYKVVGNKVDIYKKIIGLNGNYYFKNGVSCSENTWTRESTVVLE